MESWEDLNYRTSTSEKWIGIMNVSTVEWNLGPFPPGIIAIPGPLNDTNRDLYANEAFVIANVGQSQLGGRAIEQIIFGITSFVVIVLAGLWLRFHWGKILAPKGDDQSSRPGSRRTNYTATTGMNGGEAGYLSHDAFRDKLRNYYYDQIQTELELGEKNILTEGVNGEDVEHATGLLRKMYGIDMKLWAHQNVHRATQQDKAGLEMKSDAVLAEVRRIISSWERPRPGGGNPTLDWGLREQAELNNIKFILSGLPQSRYNIQPR